MKNKYLVIKKDECTGCAGRGKIRISANAPMCPACGGLGIITSETDLESAVLDIIKTNSGSINMALQRAYLK